MTGSQIIDGMKWLLLWEKRTVEAATEIEPDKLSLKEYSRNECDWKALISDLLQQVHIALKMGGGAYKLHSFHLHDNFNVFKSNAMKKMLHRHMFSSYLNL